MNRPTTMTGKGRRSRQIRRRRDRRKQRCVFAPGPNDRNKPNCISMSGNGNQEWNISKLPKRKSKVKSLNLLTSKAWIKTSQFPNSDAFLPYIDRVGKFTGMATYRCNLTPQGYIATVITTIHRRLRLWIVRHQSLSEYNKRQSLMLKAAAYYALSKNVYFWDRILFLSKELSRNWRTISKVLHRYTAKLDEHKWFVYGHVCMQTQWLTLRALRPRDKSAYSDREFMYKRSDLGSHAHTSDIDYDYLWHSYVEMSQL